MLAMCTFAGGAELVCESEKRRALPGGGIFRVGVMDLFLETRKDQHSREGGAEAAARAAVFAASAEMFSGSMK